MKKELLEKIYKQIFECENQIKGYNNKNYDNETSSRYDDGRKVELEENIVFCYDLIDEILEE